MSKSPVDACQDTPSTRSKKFFCNAKKEFWENPIRCTTAIASSLSWVAVLFYFLSDTFLPKASQVYILSANITTNDTPTEQTKVDIRFAYSGRSEVWAIRGYVVAESMDHSFTGRSFLTSVDNEGQPLPNVVEYIPKNTSSIYVCTQSVSRNQARIAQAFTLESVSYASGNNTTYRSHEYPFSMLPACAFFTGDLIGARSSKS